MIVFAIISGAAMPVADGLAIPPNSQGPALDRLSGRELERAADGLAGPEHPVGTLELNGVLRNALRHGVTCCEIAVGLKVQAVEEKLGERRGAACAGFDRK